VEVFPGRWTARVRNLGSDLLSFGAARQEAVRLYRRREMAIQNYQLAFIDVSRA